MAAFLRSASRRVASNQPAEGGFSLIATSTIYSLLLLTLSYHSSTLDHAILVRHPPLRRDRRLGVVVLGCRGLQSPNSLRNRQRLRPQMLDRALLWIRQHLRH